MPLPATRSAAPSGDPGWDHGMVQRTLGRIYQRLGSRVVVVAIVIGVAVPIITAVVTAVLVLRYLRISLDEEIGPVVALAFTLLLAALAISAFLTRHAFATVL